MTVEGCLNIISVQLQSNNMSSSLHYQQQKIDGKRPSRMKND